MKRSMLLAVVGLALLYVGFRLDIFSGFGDRPQAAAQGSDWTGPTCTDDHASTDLRGDGAGYVVTLRPNTTGAVEAVRGISVRIGNTTFAFDDGIPLGANATRFNLPSRPPTAFAYDVEYDVQGVSYLLECRYAIGFISAGSTMQTVKPTGE